MSLLFQTPPLPQHAFMAWCSFKEQEQLYHLPLFCCCCCFCLFFIVFRHFSIYSCFEGLEKIY